MSRGKTPSETFANSTQRFPEGDKAFQRLQEEIIKTSLTVDHSILAWKNPLLESEQYPVLVDPNLLALSPAWFRHAQGIISWALPQSEIFEISQSGLRLTVLKFDGEDTHMIALNCRYQDKPLTRIAIPLLQRPHVEELNLDDRHRPPGVAEISYERAHHGVHHELEPAMSEEPLTSIDAGSFQSFRWTKRTLTITRQSFAYPLHGDRMHVELDSCRAGPHSQDMYKPVRQQMLQLLRHKPSEHDWNGRLNLDIRKQGTVSYDEANMTSIYIEIRHYFTYKRPPYLYLRTSEMGTDTRWRNSLSNGETRMFPAAKGNLSISARYVNVVDEFLWSIKIKPVVSGDESIPGEEQKRIAEKQDDMDLDDSIRFA